MKQYILFDHDGVLVDTELWYFKGGDLALAGVLSRIARGGRLETRLRPDSGLRDVARERGRLARGRAGRGEAGCDVD